MLLGKSCRVVDPSSHCCLRQPSARLWARSHKRRCSHVSLRAIDQADGVITTEESVAIPDVTPIGPVEAAAQSPPVNPLDSVTEQLGAIADDIGRGAAELSQNLQATAASGASVLQEYVSSVQEGAQGPVEAAAQSPPVNPLDSVTEQLGATADDVGRGAAELSQNLQATAASGASVLQEYVNSVQQGAQVGTSTVQDYVQGVQSNLTGGIEGTGTYLSTSAEDVSKLVSSTSKSVYDSLPSPVQTVLQETEPLVRSVLEYISQHQTGFLVVSGGVLLTAGVLYWDRYKGLLTPQQALKKLSSEGALLIDIRQEAERKAQGIPDVRTMRSRDGEAGVVVPVLGVPATVAKLTRNPSQLSKEITAAVIAGLKEVNPQTPLVIMDSSGGTDAAVIARLLRQAGISRAGIISGGFKQWRQDKLAVDAKASDYSLTPLEQLSLELESAASNTRGALLSGLSNTSLVLGATLGGLGIFYVVTNVHTVLENIGVIILIYFSYQASRRYSSLQELFDDAARLIPSGVLKLPKILKGKKSAEV